MQTHTNTQKDTQTHTHTHKHDVCICRCLRSGVWKHGLLMYIICINIHTDIHVCVCVCVCVCMYRPLLEERGVEAWAIDILGWGFTDRSSSVMANV